MIDGIWYKPSDSVVVLDAAIGKYNAKYLFLANDEVYSTACFCREAQNQLPYYFVTLFDDKH